MNGAGVHICIYIYVYGRKNIFSDRLTFSNICSKASCKIYRIAVLLCTPETLSSMSKSRISIFNAHLTLFVHSMTSHNSIGNIDI